MSTHATRLQAEGARAYAAGDLDGAEARFQLALEHEPGMPHAMAGLGLIARLRADRPAARRWLLAAVRADGDLAEAHAALGALELEDGHAEAAMRRFRAALDVDPGFAIARHDLARALAQRGRTDEAIAELRKLVATRGPTGPLTLSEGPALSAGPESKGPGTAWGELADLERQRGRRAAAADAAARALALDPGDTVALRVRAGLLRDRGAATDALAVLDHALGLAPADALLHLDRGVVLVLLGRTDDAIPDLQRAIALAPALPAARFAFGATLAERGDDAGAVPALADAARLARAQGFRHLEAEQLLAEATARLGRR